VRCKQYEADSVSKSGVHIITSLSQSSFTNELTGCFRLSIRTSFPFPSFARVRHPANRCKLDELRNSGAFHSMLVDAALKVRLTIVHVKRSDCDRFSSIRERISGGIVCSFIRLMV
jgi:hypothetical protein